MSQTVLYEIRNILQGNGGAHPAITEPRFRMADTVLHQIRDLLQNAAGGGGGAPTDATYVTLSANATLSAEAVLGSSVLMKGTLAARPAAATDGLFYWTTDEGILYRDNGTTWDKIAVRDYADLEGIPSTFSPSAHKTSHEPGGSDALTALSNSSIVAGAGIVESKLALNFATHSNANDPSADEKAALAGTAGTPSTTNKYVTNDDTRNTNARTPTSHVLATGTALGGEHTISGATAGEVLRALSATTAAFDVLQYSDLGNVPSTFAPSAHASSHYFGGSDPLLSSLILGSDGSGFSGDLTAFTGSYATLGAIGDLGTSGKTPFILGNYGNDTNPVKIQVFKTRSTTNQMTGNTAVVTGDALFRLDVFGSDGTDYDFAARLEVACEGTIATGQIPGVLKFSTASSAGALTEQMRITSGGCVGIGTTTPIDTLKLHINGSFYNGSQTSLDSDLTTVVGSTPPALLERSASNYLVGLKTGSLGTDGFQIIGMRTKAAAQNANTAVTSGQELLALVAYGADGAAYQNAAKIAFEVDGTPGSGDMPGRISFSTSADGGTTLTTQLVIDNAGAALFTSSVKSKSASAGVGYATGAGGTVTQVTSKATGVTLNTICGAITTHNANLAAAAEVSFTLTNSAIAATDVVAVSIKSGATVGAYAITVSAVAAGSCSISLSNLSAGTLGEAIVINFVVLKAVTS